MKKKNRCLELGLRYPSHYTIHTRDRPVTLTPRCLRPKSYDSTETLVLYIYTVQYSLYDLQHRDMTRPTRWLMVVFSKIKTKASCVYQLIYRLVRGVCTVLCTLYMYSRKGIVCAENGARILRSRHQQDILKPRKKGLYKEYECC